MAKALNKISNMPQIRAAFNDWTYDITLIKITQAVTDGILAQTEVPINFRGTVQPLSPEEVQLKPEGQRAWPWLQIHCISDFDTNLRINDRIQYADKKYKVMARLDYSLNNYVEYHLVEDYQVA